VTHPEKKDKTPACDGQNIAATDVAAYRPPKYAYGRDFSKVSLLLHLLYKVSAKLTFEKKKYTWHAALRPISQYPHINMVL